MKNEELKNGGQPEEVKIETTTVTGSPEGGEGAAAPEKSARDLFNESVREFAPDGKYDEDENEYYSKGNEMIAALKEKGKKWDDMSEKLLKRFQSDPEDAAAFLDFAEGMPLVAAIVKNKGREALAEPMEGEDGWDEFNQANEERKSKRKNAEDLLSELEKNAKESEERLNKLAEEKGWSEEEKQAFWNYIYGDLDKIAKGNVDDDFINKSMRSYNYDKDVAAALEQGKADGRNEKIDAERKRAKGSGLPGGAGGANAAEEVEEKASNPTLDFLSRMRR